MWTLVREHLILKIAIVLIGTLALGFGLPAIINARLQSDELDRQSAESAGALAEGLAAGVRTAMLSGNGITARRMVQDARGRITSADLRIYAPNGEEVFTPTPPPPSPEDIPPHVARVLASKKPDVAPDGARAIPIPNEQRCQKCHPDGELRAVLTIGCVLGDDAKLLSAVSATAQSAFVQVMTAEKEDGLDAYFAEIAAKTAAVDAITIVGPEGDHAFGAEEIPAPADTIKKALGGGEATTVDVGDTRVLVDPIAIESQCLACHDAEPKVRGAIITALRPGAADHRDTLLQATDVSLRHVMLAGLGRLIARFLDGLPSTGSVSSLTLHDAEGRLWRDAFATPEPPHMVAKALEAGEVQSEDAPDAFTFIEPLLNDSECQQCHGTDDDLRGAIEIVLDTTGAHATSRMVINTGIGFGLGTIVLTLVVVYLGLRALVIRPVNEIGAVADKVGGGRLDTHVDVKTVDEIGRLGERLNQMISELRKKLELSKFVSQATVSSVDAAESSVERIGKRCRMAVLFSDIRGFTAFSETVEPEAVVEMLNRYFDAQADVVKRWGGDIDKFVGDELMANFRDDDMVQRAVQCAVEMVEAVERLNADLPAGTPRLQVGIGINVGDVVFGAMGARDRMDFTVIGDAVNLGARLCDAAAPSQIVASAHIRQEVGLLDGILFEPRAPISVKGKREPLQTFAVRRAPY